MFKKILIANRGEIACRVMKTAKKLNIHTVAVYSAIDSNSKHVNLADSAFYIGENDSKDSYLNMMKIIEIAKKTGSEAIHPGYGFLSENSKFVKLCEENNIKFIGPSAQSMNSMGSKIGSKVIMEKAKVPVVPGYYGDNQNRDFLIETARSIKYPILIKADLGGGGKGMRIVRNENEFFDMLKSAQNESENSFGSAKILLEKYLENSKHIEVQVFGDHHGNYVHLFERDCTIQRRHQKVLEEAPSYLDEKMRLSLCESGVKAAKAVDYYNAGTVEFIFDINEKKFYFMEMNTRLQVEHPISEMITGQDFVEWQLIVASGGNLPLKQEQIKRKGHSMEVRIYSEDPDNGFLPNPGKIIQLKEPNHVDSLINPDKNVRIETGVRENDEVSIYYDPMISKLVVWAEDREHCRKKLLHSLENYKCLGVKNNIKFLQTLIKHPKVVEWDFDTNFIAKHNTQLINLPIVTKDEDILSTVLCHLLNNKQNYNKNFNNNQNPWYSLNNYRVNHTSTTHFKLYNGLDKLDEATNKHKNENIINVDLVYLDEDTFSLTINNKNKKCVYESVSAKIVGDNQVEVNILKDKIYKVHFFATEDDNIILLKKDGSATNIEFIKDDYEMDNELESNPLVKAPMSSKVKDIFVKVGQVVQKGDKLVSVIAMKMEHVILASKKCKIVNIYCKEDHSVKSQELLVELEFLDETDTKEKVKNKI